MGFSKINPKAAKGLLDPGNTPSWMSYYSLQYVPNSISSIKGIRGSLYMGNNIQAGSSAGASPDGNFVFWTGYDSITATNPPWPLTLTSGSSNVIIVNSATAAGNNTNTSVILGSRVTWAASLSGNVIIGNGASSTGSTSVVIGNGSSGTNSNVVTLGTGSSASGLDAVALGRSATASNTCSIAIGGNGGISSPISSTFCGVAIGSTTNTSTVAQNSFMSQKFAGVTDTSLSLLSFKCQTTTATQTEMGFNSGNQQSTTTNSYYVFPATTNNTAAFDIELVARRTDVAGEYAMWKINFVANIGTSNASTVVSTPVISLIGSNSGNIWSVTVSADITNGRPAIFVTGEASKTIRWVAGAKVTTVGN